MYLQKTLFLMCVLSERPSFLAHRVGLVAVLALCSGCPEGIEPVQDHSCIAANHCQLINGEALCEPGYGWLDPDESSRDFRCVQLLDAGLAADSTAGDAVREADAAQADAGQQDRQLSDAHSPDRLTADATVADRHSHDVARADSARADLLQTDSSPGADAARNDAELQCEDWQRQVVDDEGDTGVYAVIAIDGADTTHFAYYHKGYDQLRYARRETGQLDWNIETVDRSANVGWYASIGVDSSDTPHISYYDVTHHSLRYARRLGEDSWHYETVEDLGNSGGSSSIAVSPAGDVHIVHHDYRDFDLRYAFRASGSTIWQTETVDGQDRVGNACEIAVDTNGGVHISYYYDEPGEDLRYAYRARNARAWSVETVDSEGTVGWYTSITVDDQQRPWIAYHDETNSRIKLAHKTAAGQWQIEPVVDDADEVAIAWRAGQVHLAIYQDEAQDLLYARRSTQGVWSVLTVDSEGWVGLYPTIALRAGGEVVLGYVSESTEELLSAELLCD